jgi:hypothetical protein
MTMERLFTLQCDGEPCEEYSFDEGCFSGELWERAKKQGWKRIGTEHFCPWCYEALKKKEQ